MVLANKGVIAILEFAAQNLILPLTEESVTLCADIYATMRRGGTPVDEIDLLIAGVAISNGLVLVTHNQRHFNRIDGSTKKLAATLSATAAK